MIDGNWLRAMSESVESATSALARNDLQGLESETSRQLALLRKIPFDGPQIDVRVAGDDGSEACAPDQHELRAVLAHQLAVLRCAVTRGIRSVIALRSLLPHADGTYSALVAQRRS
ncbi:MAG: hypothetical protein ROO76_01760 [Terriglobia bacterium]|jgi:hypothetical protein|nr:hypothetical protein [Terriglobia bacterium]